MKILELLLPKSMIDKGLSTKSMKQIDTLQVRMDLYVDKLCGMAAGTARDFLKSKLKADYIALKDIIKKNNIAESVENIEDKQYEVYDRQTGKVVGKPYSNLSRASRAVDRLDNKYGGYRYGKRPIAPVSPIAETEELDELSVNTLKSYFGKSGKDAEGHIAKAKAGEDKDSSSAHAKKRMGGMKQAMGKLSKAKQRGEKLSEAVHKLPLTPEDFEMVKRLMEKPIPAIVAPIYISEIINDDELNDQFTSLEETDPGRDIRPLIVEWLSRVMPDQMYRFGQAVADENQRKGLLSPIHGYDDHQYKSANDVSPGNATGRF